MSLAHPRMYARNALAATLLLAARDAAAAPVRWKLDIWDFPLTIGCYYTNDLMVMGPVGLEIDTDDQAPWNATRMRLITQWAGVIEATACEPGDPNEGEIACQFSPRYAINAGNPDHELERLSLYFYDFNQAPPFLPNGSFPNTPEVFNSWIGDPMRLVRVKMEDNSNNPETCTGEWQGVHGYAPEPIVPDGGGGGGGGATASAALIPLQGTLTDAQGAPVQGAQAVTFTLSSGPDLASATALATSTAPVLFVDGAFSTALEIPGTAAHDALADGAWVTVTVGGATSEPVPVGWAPRAVFARDAATLGGMDPSDFLPSTYAPAWSELTGAPGDNAALATALGAYATTSALSGYLPATGGTVSGNLTSTGNLAASGTLRLGAGGAITACGGVNAGTLRYNAGSLEVCDASMGWATVGQLRDGGHPRFAAASCKAIADLSAAYGSGTYWIDPDGTGSNQPFQVWCDMTAGDAGWTVILSNQNLFNHCTGAVQKAGPSAVGTCSAGMLQQTTAQWSNGETACGAGTGTNNTMLCSNVRTELASLTFASVRATTSGSCSRSSQHWGAFIRNSAATSSQSFNANTTTTVTSPAFTSGLRYIGVSDGDISGSNGGTASCDKRLSYLAVR